MAETTQKLKVPYTVAEVDYAVLRPNPKLVGDAQRVYSRKFRELAPEAILAQALDEILRKQNLWDDEKKAENERLNAEIVEQEKVLGRGYRTSDKGVKTPLKVSEAKAVALSLRELREKLTDLLRVRTAYANETVEAQADNAKFNFLVANCLVYNQGERAGQKVFKDTDDYLEHAAEPYAFQGANHLASMLYGGADSDWRRKLPENKFLLRYGFVDDKLRLVSKDGKLVDVDGRLINAEGRYIDEKNQFVNKKGDRVDEAGDFVFEDRMEFVDDLAGEEKSEATVVADSEGPAAQG